MTKTLLLTLLVAFSLNAKGQDTTETRLKRLEESREAILVINYRIILELEKLHEKTALLEKESRRDNILIEGLIGEVIELRKMSAK